MTAVVQLRNMKKCGFWLFFLADSHFLSDMVLNILKESDMLPNDTRRSLRTAPCL